MLMPRTCLLLLAVGLLLAPLACDGKTGKKPSKAAKPASVKESEKPKGPSPAAKALEAMLQIPVDVPAEKKLPALAAGYERYTKRIAAKARDNLALRAGYSSMNESKRKKFLEVMCGGALNIDDYVPFKEFNEKVNEQALAVFGLTWKEIKGKEPGELRDLWIARKENWENCVIPDLKGVLPTGERDFGDRLYLFFEGSGRKVEIMMMQEREGYKYAGTWEDRSDYLIGPDRVLLFELKTDADRLDAARNDLSDLQSLLLVFRQKQGCYPTGQEGLDALLENPGGNDGHSWEGPYAHHIHDPWGSRWRLDVPGKHNPDWYDLWSPGPDGKDGTADDIENW